MRVEKTVFISYRRTNVYNALAIYQNLIHNGYDVFFDYDSIKSGDFAQIILNQIGARAHFVVLLTPSALERCNEPGDWLRKEIEHAIDTKRNIIPLMFEGFSFKDVEQYLTGKMALLKNYNAMRVPSDYFNAAMDRLRDDYLNIALDTVIHPAPPAQQAQVAHIQAQAASQPKPSEKQLSAEEWFEQGFKRAKIDYDSKIADYTEAIRLNPQYALAYYNRGNARSDKGDKDGAIADYTEAIRLNAQFANAYYGRGFVRSNKGDKDGAIADFTEAIRLNPQYADAYWGRGFAYKNKGDLRQANTDYQRYVDLGGEEADKLRGWIRDNEAELRKLGK